MTKLEHEQTARALKAEVEVQKLITVLAQMRGQQAQAEAARLGAELDALGEWAEAPVADGVSIVSESVREAVTGAVT